MRPSTAAFPGVAPVLAAAAWVLLAVHPGDAPAAGPRPVTDTPSIVVDRAGLGAVTLPNTGLDAWDTVAVSLSDGGARTVTVTVKNASPWLVVESGGTLITPGLLAVHIDASHVDAVTTYADTLVLTADSTSNSPVLIPVTAIGADLLPGQSSRSVTLSSVGEADTFRIGLLPGDSVDAWAREDPFGSPDVPVVLELRAPDGALLLDSAANAFRYQTGAVLPAMTVVEGGLYHLVVRGRGGATGRATVSLLESGPATSPNVEELRLRAPEGGVPVMEELGLTNRGTGTARVAPSALAAWLSVAPGQVELPGHGATAGVQVTADPTGLSQGEHGESVKLTESPSRTGVYYVDVHLRVHDPSWEVVVEGLAGVRDILGHPTLGLLALVERDLAVLDPGSGALSVLAAGAAPGCCDGGVLALAPDSSVILAAGAEVLRVSPDGSVSPLFTADGRVVDATAVADGTIYLATASSLVKRSPDGTVATLLSATDLQALAFNPDDGLVRIYRGSGSWSLDPAGDVLTQIGFFLETRTGLAVGRSGAFYARSSSGLDFERFDGASLFESATTPAAGSAVALTEGWAWAAGAASVSRTPVLDGPAGFVRLPGLRTAQDLALVWRPIVGDTGTVSLSFEADDGSAVPVTLREHSEWFSLPRDTATTPATLSVSWDARFLAPGTYIDTLWVESPVVKAPLPLRVALSQLGLPSGVFEVGTSRTSLTVGSSGEADTLRYFLRGGDTVDLGVWRVSGDAAFAPRLLLLGPAGDSVAAVGAAGGDPGLLPGLVVPTQGIHRLVVSDYRSEGDRDTWTGTYDVRTRASAAVLRAADGPMAVAAPVGGSPGESSFWIRNRGGLAGSLTLSAPDAAWLTPTPSTPTVPARDSAEVMLRATPAALPRGLHHGSLVLDGPDDPWNGDDTLAVSFRVHDATSSAQVSLESRSTAAAVDVAGLLHVAGVDGAGTPTLVTVDPSGGSVSPRSAVLPAAVSDLAVGLDGALWAAGPAGSAMVRIGADDAVSVPYAGGADALSIASAPDGSVYAAVGSELVVLDRYGLARTLARVASGPFASALAFQPLDGRLYYVRGAELRWVEPVSGADSLVAVLEPADSAAVDLAAGRSGRLYLLTPEPTASVGVYAPGQGWVERVWPAVAGPSLALGEGALLGAGSAPTSAAWTAAVADGPPEARPTLVPELARMTLSVPAGDTVSGILRVARSDSAAVLVTLQKALPGLTLSADTATTPFAVVVTFDATGVVPGTVLADTLLLSADTSVVAGVPLRVPLRIQVTDSVGYAVAAWAGDARGTEGGTATVPLFLDLTPSGKALGSYEGRLTWDTTALALDTVWAGAFEGVFSAATDSAALGVLRFAGASSTSANTDTVQVASVRFAVRGVAGDSASVGLEMGEVFTTDFVRLTGALVPRGGWVRVAAGIIGDVDGNLSITAVDALAILSHVVGRVLPAGWDVVGFGDVNCDGSVTALDALITLSKVVGKDVSAFCIGG